MDAPIRRRSFATPGIATRTASIEEIHQVAPAPEIYVHSPQTRQWDAEIMRSFPPNRLTGLAPIAEGRDSPAPRAPTPGDFDYSHLGTLKLGSLVVTNGAPSPEPSIQLRNQYSFEIHSEEGYFTASEGRTSPEDIMNNSVLATEGNVNVPEILAHSMPTPVKLNTVAMTIDRLRREADQEELEEETDNRSVVDEKEVVHLHRSSTIAREYSSEFSSNPYFYQNTSAEGPSQPSPSRNGDVDALSHHDHTAHAPEEVSAVRESPHASRNPGRLSRGMSSKRMEAPQMKLPQENATYEPKRPLQMKIDSGYSSAASSGALQQTRRPEEVARGPVRADVPRANTSGGWKPDEDDTESLYTFEQMLTMPYEEPKRAEASEPQTAAPEPARPARPRSKSFTKAIRKSLPSLRSSESTPAVTTLQSMKNNTPPKKLQKRRPLSWCPIVVQSNRPIASVPGVPDDVVEQFSHRLTTSPGMEHLEHTYASVTHTDLAEAPDSPIQYGVPIRFPSPNGSSPRSNDVSSGVGRPPTPPQHRSSLSLRKKSSAPQIEGFELASISDFGTVAQSLGGSPYDIAMSAVKTKPQSSAPIHPHQLSSNAPRSRSAGRTDAETAAERAQMRSRDRSVPDMSRTHVSRLRSPLEYQQEGREHDLRRHSTVSSTTSRSRRFDEDCLSQTDSKPVNFSRPHSLYGDAPPVPPLPFAGDASPSKDASPASSRIGPQTPPRAAKRTSIGRMMMEAETMPTERASISLDRALVSEEESQSKWSAHARLWRERRKSIGEGLLAKSSKPPATPAIVVSRYVTPTLQSPTSELPAELPVFAPRPASMNMSRPAIITRNSEPVQGRPTYSRASTVGSVYSTNTSSSDAQSPGTSSRPSSTAPTENSGASLRSRDASHRKSFDASLIDRYSGGLDYNYEPGLGLGGSAGTRDLRSVASRKSLVTSYQFGIDLSDVPVFLQRGA